MEEVGEDLLIEGLNESEDDDILELGIDSLVSSQESIEEINANELEFKELEIEDENDDLNLLEVDRMLESFLEDKDEQLSEQHELIDLDSEEDIEEIEILKKFSRNREIESEVQQVESNQDWMMFTEEDQEDSDSYLDLSPSSTPNRHISNFVTPSKSTFSHDSHSLHSRGEDISSHSPQISRITATPLISPLLPLSTDRTNLFQSQENEEVLSNSSDQEIHEEFSLPLHKPIFSSQSRSFTVDKFSSPTALNKSSKSTSSDLISTPASSKKKGKKSKVSNELDVFDSAPIASTSKPKKRRKKNPGLNNDIDAISTPNLSSQPANSQSSNSQLSNFQPSNVSLLRRILPKNSAPSIILPLPSSAVPRLGILQPNSALEEDRMQAEMDAYFGFVDLNRPPLLAVPVQTYNRTSTDVLANSIPGETASIEKIVVEKEKNVEKDSQDLGVRYSKVEKGKSKEQEVQAGFDVVVDEKEVTPVYQLQPIPTHSVLTGNELTENEKRLAIIEALERLTLSILSQLISSAIPPASLVPLPLPSTKANKTILSDAPESQTQTQQPQSQSESQKQTQSQSQSQNPIQVTKIKKRTKGPAPAWKPPPVIVILAKRVDGKSYDPTNTEKLELGTKRLIYPRTNTAECGSPPLARLLKVIEYILDGLKRKVISTKRDLYYRSVKLFENQSRVDTLVEDIAATLKVRRNDLNVVAASKGLFGGFIKIIGLDGICREGGDSGCLIPPSQAIASIEIDKVDWILVIEKEAVFQSLCCPEFLENIPNLGRGILITGKGYPDVATRELVHSISITHPSIPLLCLVDSDPHGLEILSTYKFGSASLSFDNLNLSIPNLEWLGIKGSEFNSIGINRDDLIELSKGDRKKAGGMLNRDWIPVEWKNELEYMLHLNRKAEIQILSSTLPSNSTTNLNLIEDFLMNGINNEQENEEAGGEETVKASKLFDYVATKIISRITKKAD